MNLEMSTTETFELKITDNEVRLKDDGFLYVYKSDNETKVELKACFPWTYPVSYLSLKDKGGKEHLLIESLDKLSSESKEAVEKAMEESGFCFQVIDIVSVEEEFELRVWSVKTKQGLRKFQTQLLSWPRETPGGGLLIQDVHGDLYFVEQPKSLPEKARKILWAFTD